MDLGHSPVVSVLKKRHVLRSPHAEPLSLSTITSEKSANVFARSVLSDASPLHARECMCGLLCLQIRFHNKVKPRYSSHSFSISLIQSLQNGVGSFNEYASDATPNLRKKKRYAAF